MENEDDEIIEALITIQKYCNKFEDCDGCKLVDGNKRCEIRKLPTDWKINKDREIKYLL